ncbi:uncharacterized protein LOC144928581 [Branchiostoma floridae x Branchiostoma belcheri]
MRRYFNVKPKLAYASCARFITGNQRQTFLITKEASYLKIELVSSVEDDAGRFSHGPSVKKGLDEDLREIIQKWVPGIRYEWCLRCSCADHKEKGDVDRFLPIDEAKTGEYFKSGVVVCGVYTPATSTVRDIGLADWFQDPRTERGESSDQQGGPLSGRRKRKRSAASVSSSDQEEPRKRRKQPPAAGAKRVDVRRYFDKVVRGASAKWDDLARRLKFEENEIDGIRDLRRDNDSRCREVLKRWRNRKGKAGKTTTLQTLKKALKKIGHTLTAESLEAI